MTNFAIYIRSAHSAKMPRETVVIPSKTAGIVVLTRINTGSQGASNAWSVGAPVGADMELVYGSPIALAVTEKDEAGYLATGRWSDLTQRLVRVGKAQTSITSDRLGLVLGNIVADLTADPMAGSVYTKGASVASVPTTNVVSQSAPAPVAVASVTASDSAPAPVATAVAPVQSVAPAMAFRIPTLNDPDVAGHVERIVDGQSFSKVLDHARATQQSVALVGEAGTGKTSGTVYYAGLRGLPVFIFDCNSGITELQVEGQVTLVNGQTVWQDSMLVQALRQPSVVLLNESNRMGQKQQALLFSILAERQLLLKSKAGGELVHVHPDCLIVTDFNDGIGYGGTSGHDTAFRDRFDIPIRFTYDRDVESQVLVSDTLQDVAWMVRNDPISFRQTPFSLRLLKRFEKNAPALGIDFAIARLCEAFADSIEREALRNLIAPHKDTIAKELGL